MRVFVMINKNCDTEHCITRVYANEKRAKEDMALLDQGVFVLQENLIFPIAPKKGKKGEGNV